MTGAATFPSTIEALGGWPELLRREDVNLRCVDYLGLLSVEIGRKFACVLPGHPHDHPAASLYWDRKGRAPTGMLKYRDWHYATGDATYNQADVFAARNYHVSRQLHGPEITAWQLRFSSVPACCCPILCRCGSCLATLRVWRSGSMEAIGNCCNVSGSIPPATPHRLPGSLRQPGAA